jgi:CheY-like chemotaxis protein
MFFFQHARVGGAELVKTGSPHPAHSSANRHARRGSATWADRRRFRVPQQANHNGQPQGVDRAPLRIRTRFTEGLLIVEDNPAELLGITELLRYEDIEVVTADNGREALAMLREQPTDCVILDLKLPDMSGFELLEHIRQDDALMQVPVVVFTGRELSPEEDDQLHSLVRSVIVKGVESLERLLDETALFPSSHGRGSPAG